MSLAVDKNDKIIIKFLEENFYKILDWYSWYDVNYHNKNLTSSYMWNDIAKDFGSLSSGLGDYPRILRKDAYFSMHLDL